MKNDFKGLSEKLAQGMNFDANAVVLLTAIGDDGTVFQRGSVSQIAKLTAISISKLLDAIHSDRDREIIKDYIIEMMNAKVGL